ncbi:MAG: HlyD family type I secretion periplasmic adaptor subunit [Desulfovibrio sp.]|jgi:adhesin transport system membrane fusion protein|nr:HlyD family type I secretion periplasmic adaptor subunit [Desulfovibrio sp.]
MDLTSRKNRTSAVLAPGQGAMPLFEQRSARSDAKGPDIAKDDNELPSMPGMPGDGINQFFAAMLDKKRNPNDPDVSVSPEQPDQFDMRPLGAASDKEKKEDGGPWLFLRDMIFGGGHEQKPDRNFLQSVRSVLGHRKQDQAASGGKPAGPSGAAGMFAAMDAPLRGLTPDDVQFAGEVDAALARRPRFGVRTLSVTVAVMLLLLIIWAAFAEIDEVTHAEGQVVGSQRTQTIQNLEGGILRAVLVREGQIVEKGDILAQLDNEMAESSYRDATNKAIENSLATMRLESELKNQRPVYPADLKAWAGRLIGQSVDENTVNRARQIVDDQENAWVSRQERLNAELDVLKAQYEQRQHDLGEQIARKNQLDRSLAISIEQRDTAYSLLLRNNFSRMEYLGLQQKVVELQGQIDMLAASIPKAQAAADEFVQRIASRRAEQNTAITDEINKRRQELNSLRETLSAGGDRVTRTELRTPVRGTVKQIYINTVGGVVKPGEPIMDIVPLDNTLLVEARVLPKDVAFLRPGQEVMVKISAYDFSIYGGLEGKLESISADTIEDKRGNYHYLVKVRTQKTSIIYHNEVLPIIPGMMVTTDIMIGKKSVLDYLLKPILKAKQNALRER